MFNEENFPARTRYADASLSKLELSDEAMDKLSEWVKSPKGFLIYTGTPGVGKTYFCACVINFMNEKKRKCIYKNESEFLRVVRNSIKDGDGDYSYQVAKMASYSALWLLDDIGSSQMTEWQKEVLLTFVDDLYAARKPAIITSNIWLRDMGSHFSQRFRSRLAASENTIIEITTADLRQQGM